MTHKTFHDFLVDKHAEQYTGLDDEMGEDFTEWENNLSADEWEEYGEEFAKEKVKECVDKQQAVKVNFIS